MTGTGCCIIWLFQDVIATVTPENISFSYLIKNVCCPRKRKVLATRKHVVESRKEMNVETYHIKLFYFLPVIKKINFPLLCLSKGGGGSVTIRVNSNNKNKEICFNIINHKQLLFSYFAVLLVFDQSQIPSQIFSTDFLLLT